MVGNPTPETPEATLHVWVESAVSLSCQNYQSRDLKRLFLLVILCRYRVEKLLYDNLTCKKPRTKNQTKIIILIRQNKRNKINLILYITSYLINILQSPLLISLSYLQCSKWLHGYSDWLHRGPVCALKLSEIQRTHECENNTRLPIKMLISPKNNPWVIQFWH